MSVIWHWKMFRFSTAALQLIELLLSSAVHLLYGFYIFSSAVAGDLSLAINALFFKSNIEASIRDVGSVNSDDDLPPIVLVHGIFGFGKGVSGFLVKFVVKLVALKNLGLLQRIGGLSYFAGAEKKDEKVLVPDLGSLTSIYDRARELFYYLKGGQVDYGEEHSKACGHSQFGRIYEEGHYPQWDEDHPIHFVGHSAGAQVIRVLQQMLADKAFKGYENTSENWVLSVTSLSGAFNRTTRAYLDGMQPEDGKSMKSICLLQLLRVGVIVYDWIDIPILKYYYNFGFDHYNMSWRKAGIWGLSIVFLEIQMCQWRHPPDVPPPFKGYRDEEWWDNDGALNTVPMTHPRFPVEHPSRFVVKDSECQPLQPGIWYYKIVEGDHILYIVNRERAGVQFDLIYDSIFEHCRKHAFRKIPTMPDHVQ